MGAGRTPSIEFALRENRSDQEDRDGAKAMSDCSSSPWFTMSSRFPDSHVGSFDKFVASSSSSYPSSRTDPSVEGSLSMDSVLVGRVVSISSGMARRAMDLKG